MAIKAIPEGLRTVTPAIIVRDGTKAIEFYKQAFGAEAKGVHLAPDGRVAHAELLIGDSVVMLSDEFPGFSTSPQTLGGSSVCLNIYVENVDALFNRASAAGAKVVMPLADQFWGDRYGVIEDPFGHRWALAAHVEDVAPEEMARRSKEAFAKMASAAKAQ